MANRPSIYSRPLSSDLLDPMSQTMLLTKRLNTFLSQNTTPQLPTLILISPTGKLLNSSSPLPASTLRTQATLACTLWNLYRPISPSSSDLISTTLSSQPRAQSQAHSTSDSALSTQPDNDLSSITIQLSHGIMVIRALKCGLLFVAIGQSSQTTSGSPYPSSQALPSQAQHLSSTSPASPPSSPPVQNGDGHETPVVGSLPQRELHRDLSVPGVGSGAPSESGSVGSTGTRAQASIMAIRRQAEEVGKWLESRLEGFVLGSGEGR
jgi:hypothetical protein